MTSNAQRTAEHMVPTTRNIARNILVVLAGFNGLIAIGLASMLAANMPATIEAFGIPYTPVLASLGITIGGLLLVIGVLHGFAVAWTRQGRVEGMVIIVAYAVFLVAVGIIDFVRLGQTNILLFDGIRGVLTIVAGVFAYRERTR